MSECLAGLELLTQRIVQPGIDGRALVAYGHVALLAGGHLLDVALDRSTLRLRQIGTVLERGAQRRLSHVLQHSRNSGEIHIRIGVQVVNESARI